MPATLLWEPNMATLFAVSHAHKRVYVFKEFPKAVLEEFIKHHKKPGKLLLVLYNQFLQEGDHKHVELVRYVNLLSKDFHKKMWMCEDELVIVDGSDWREIEAYRVAGTRHLDVTTRLNHCVGRFIDRWAKIEKVERAEDTERHRKHQPYGSQEFEFVFTKAKPRRNNI